MRVRPQLDARSDGPGVLLSTNPPSSDYGNLTGLILQVHNGNLTVLIKGQQVGSMPLPDGDRSISVHSDGHRTTASIGEESIANLAGDRRPQVTGIYSTWTRRPTRSPGCPSRRGWTTAESYPTTLKLVVIALAVACFIGSVVKPAAAGHAGRRRPPRLVPPKWWKPTFRDVSVISALVPGGSSAR